MFSRSPGEEILLAEPPGKLLTSFISSSEEYWEWKLRLDELLTEMEDLLELLEDLSTELEDLSRTLYSVVELSLGSELADCSRGAEWREFSR